MKKHWFWSSLGYSKWVFVELLVASFLLNLFMLATPIFTKNVYDRVVPNGTFDTLWVLVIAVVVVYIFDILMKLARSYLLEFSSKKSDIVISRKIFEQVLKMKLSSRFSSVGSFANQLKEYDTLRSFFTASSIAMLIDLPFIFLFFVVIFLIGGKMVLVPIVASLIILIYSLLLLYPLKSRIERLSKIKASKDGFLIESLGSLESIKLFSWFDKSMQKWESYTLHIAKEELSYRILSNSMSFVSNLVIQLSNISMVVWGVYAIWEQSLTLGGLIALVMLSSRTLAPLNQFLALMGNYQHAKRAYKTLDTIMKLPTEEESTDALLGKIKGEICFKNVSFRYPNEEQYILENISFTIKAGEKVAIVGAIGSGKSTILKLILGLYEPQKGAVLIDGIDVRYLGTSVLRDAISYLPQEIKLFSGTLLENIQNPQKPYDEKLLELASRLSLLNRVVDRHAKGYSLEVGEHGERLSSGEREAVGLARIFTKTSASILLLDEPTRSMEHSAQESIYKSIKLFSSNKTLLFISHKPTILTLAERLIVLERGKLVLDGSRDEVLDTLSKRGAKE